MAMCMPLYLSNMCLDTGLCTVGWVVGWINGVSLGQSGSMADWGGVAEKGEWGGLYDKMQQVCNTLVVAGRFGAPKPRRNKAVGGTT